MTGSDYNYKQNRDIFKKLNYQRIKESFYKHSSLDRYLSSVGFCPVMNNVFLFLLVLATAISICCSHFHHLPIDEKKGIPSFGTQKKGTKGEFAALPEDSVAHKILLRSRRFNVSYLFSFLM